MVVNIFSGLSSLSCVFHHHAIFLNFTIFPEINQSIKWQTSAENVVSHVINPDLLVILLSSETFSGGKGLSLEQILYLRIGDWHNGYENQWSLQKTFLFVVSHHKCCEGKHSERHSQFYKVIFQSSKLLKVGLFLSTHDVQHLRSWRRKEGAEAETETEMFQCYQKMRRFYVFAHWSGRFVLVHFNF